MRSLVIAAVSRPAAATQACGLRQIRTDPKLLRTNQVELPQMNPSFTNQSIASVVHRFYHFRLPVYLTCPLMRIGNTMICFKLTKFE